MRRLLITRGAPGAGKTTLARSLGLQDHVLSADRIRQIIAGPTLGESGHWGISQEHDAQVWTWFRELLTARMTRGELLIVDATHARQRDLRRYLKLAKAHRYQLLCIDFSTMPLARCLHYNRQRGEPQRVPDAVVRRIHGACRAQRVPDDMPHVCWSEDDAHVHTVRQFLSHPILDLSHLKRIIHIGDVQGCPAPLWGPGGLLEKGLEPDTGYVWIGDYVDRGPQSAAVLTALEPLLAHPHVFALWGNHEEHLHAYAQGRELHDREFREFTRPQLEAAGLDPARVARWLDHTHEALCYTWRDHNVLVTHGGLTTVPDELLRVSTHTLTHGTGRYHDPVHELFDRHAPAGWVQVHGHRNPHGIPINTGLRTFNLEGRVEFGGALRIAVLDESGWQTRSIPNADFVSAAGRERAGRMLETSPLPPWTQAPDRRAPLPADLRGRYVEHPLVRERQSTTRPHISSYNFTRDAFLQRAWDEVTIRARGLFVDTRSGAVVARSYDKFFNVGERPDTQAERLAATMTFPVSVYVKENGYLGILGYDERHDALIFASKSSLESDFATWFEDILRETLGDSGCARIRRYLRDTSSSMVFEVIDPVRDPHMIRYDSRHVVLLDVIRRAAHYESMPFEALQALGRQLGLQVKRLATTLSHADALTGFLRASRQPGYRFSGEDVEGFVLQDAAGFQTKVKLEYYSFWKRMRSLKERVVRVRGTDRPLQRDVSHPAVAAFYAWCLRQSDEVLALDIIQLRERFEQRVEGELTEDSSPKGPLSPGPDVGFARALKQLTARHADGHVIKPDTASALLQRAVAADELVELLRDCPITPELIRVAPPSDARAEVGLRLSLGLDTGDVSD